MNQAPSRQLNILVSHLDPLLGAGLVAALRHQSSFRIFSSDTDVAEHDRPPADVIIADYERAMDLVSGDGKGAGRPVQEKIVILTANQREVDIRRAIQRGIRGYLLVDCTLDEITEGVRAVGNGLRYLCRAVAQRMADSVAAVALTSREVEVLRLVATGQPNKSIARELNIGVGTVKCHLSAIMAKLDAKSRTQATRIAVTRGLVEGCGPNHPSGSN